MRKLKILIVDDSAVMRKIIERALRQAGLDLGEVREASNGAEALSAGAKGYLRKPFTPEQVKQRVGPLLVGVL